MEVLREAPKAASFVPLAEHQSTTPASFYTGPPVLHYHSDRSKVIVIGSDLDKAPAFTPLLQNAQPGVHAQSNGHANGDSGDSETEKAVEEIDIFVTSDKLLLFSNAASVGVAIPYPTISLHAIQTLPTPSPDSTPGQGVYMQLITSSDHEEEVDTISVTLVPTATAPPTVTAPPEDDAVENEDKPEQTPVQALFNALSNCSNLHPDPVNESDEDQEGGSRLIQSGLAIPVGDSEGGLPPPMPGSGGWITAENIHEFIDEDGNFIEDEDGEVEEEGNESAALGPGAGTVRARGGEADDGDDDGDETKWQRLA